MVRCIKCGRTLSDPKSIKLGIGPICRKNSYSSKNQNPLFPKDPLKYIILTEQQAKPFKDNFSRNKFCMTCKNINLHELTIIGYYPSTEGCLIDGNIIWLYIECPKCKNDMSLWKFGAEFRKTKLKKDSNGKYFLEDLK